MNTTVVPKRSSLLGCFSKIFELISLVRFIFSRILPFGSVTVNVRALASDVTSTIAKKMKEINITLN